MSQNGESISGLAQVELPSFSEQPSSIHDIQLSSEPAKAARPTVEQHDSYTGVTVTCRELTYSVKTGKHKTLNLLTGVSLYLQPGEMLAILGPSGCGKTTLLDCLAGRKTAGHFGPSTNILYNGHAASPDYLKRYVGYVEQQDTLLSMLTPYEMLLYTAELKHARRQPLSEKKAQVARLIQKLGLVDCQNTVIGSAARRGISGGEAKRVNIGLALITNPKVLFIDELTSGLDSFTGHEVVSVVKNIANLGITVGVSIHSPPPYTFELFDRVIVLQRGRVVYFGPNGETPALYFEKGFPSLRPMRGSEGVSDFILDVTTRVNYDPVQAAVFADGYESSQLCAENLQVVEQREANSAGARKNLPTWRNRLSWRRSDSTTDATEQSHPTGDVETGGFNGSAPTSEASYAAGATPSPQPAASLSAASPEPSIAAATAGTSTISRSSSFSTDSQHQGGTVVPFWWALIVLWKYRSLKSYKSAAFIAPRVGDKIMIVFLVVTIWWQIGDNAVAATGILFLWSMLSAFTSMGILPTIVLERPVFRRERADGLYSSFVYGFYKLTEELAPQIPAGLVYSALVFYIVDLKGSFLLFWLVYLVSTANSIAVTCLVSACSPNTSVAGALMSSYATTLFFFSGYLIPYYSIPVYWRWYAVIDHLRYAFGSMMANQFESTNGTSASMSFGGVSPLEFYDLEGADSWTWLGYETIFFPVFAFMLWAALTFLQHVRR